MWGWKGLTCPCFLNPATYTCLSLPSLCGLLPLIGIKGTSSSSRASRKPLRSDGEWVGFRSASWSNCLKVHFFRVIRGLIDGSGGVAVETNKTHGATGETTPDANVIPKPICCCCCCCMVEGLEVERPRGRRAFRMQGNFGMQGSLEHWVVPRCQVHLASFWSYSGVLGCVREAHVGLGLGLYDRVPRSTGLLKHM